MLAHLKREITAGLSKSYYFHLFTCYYLPVLSAVKYDSFNIESPRRGLVLHPTHSLSDLHLCFGLVINIAVNRDAPQEALSAICRDNDATTQHTT